MNSTKELECMQQVDYNDIINFMGRYQVSLLKRLERKVI